MWAAEHPEPGAGQLPGVDSSEHQSALIHPGRGLSPVIVFYFFVIFFFQGLLRSFPRSLHPHA